MRGISSGLAGRQWRHPGGFLVALAPFCAGGNMGLGEQGMGNSVIREEGDLPFYLPGFRIKKNAFSFSFPFKKRIKI